MSLTDDAMEQVGKLFEQNQQLREQLAAATARAEQAEQAVTRMTAGLNAYAPVRELLKQRRRELDQATQDHAEALGVEACEQRTRAEEAEARLAIQVGNVHELAAELEQLRAQLAKLNDQYLVLRVDRDVWQQNAQLLADATLGKLLAETQWAWADHRGRYPQQSEGDARLIADHDRHRWIETRTVYAGEWQTEADDAPATALSATQTAPESAQGSADTNISSSPATEPTEAEPCPSCRETYCDDGKPRPA